MSDAMNESGSEPGTWFGYPAVTEAVGGQMARVVSVPVDQWSDAHRRRLLRTQTIDGLVPTITLRRTPQNLRAFQLPPTGKMLSTAFDDRSVSGLDEILAATEAAASATHAGHLTGLVHGALGADDIHIDGNDVAVSGMGLGWGGTAEAARQHYVAPEVLAGGEPSVRGDVYGLGRVLEAGLSRLQGTVPSDARAAVAEATDPDPAKRPASARALAERLSTVGGRRRRKYGLAALGGSAAAAALGTALNGRDQSGFAGSSTSSPVTPGQPGRAAETVDAARSSEPPTMPVSGAGGRSAAAVGGAAGVGAAAAAGRGSFSSSSSEARSSETVRDQQAEPEDKNRKGAWLVGGVVALAALGGLGLWANSQNGDDTDELAETAEVVKEGGESISTTEAPSTTEVATTEAEPSTTEPSTTEPEPTEPPTTEAEAQPDTTEAEPETTVPPPAAVLSAGDAAESFEILHAVPGLEVDAYIDGQLAAPGFTSGTLAGPLPLSSAGLPLDLFAAQTDPPASVDDRDDVPVLAGPIDMDGPGTLVAFADADGSVMLQSFPNNLGDVPPGQGRLAIRHVAGVGPASIELDGEMVATDVPAGSSVVVDVPAGSHSIVVIDAEGNEVLSQRIDAEEGDLTSAWIRGGGEAPVTTSIRRISGLQTAPVGIPSGNSGLAADSNRGDGLVPSLLAMLGLSGLGLVVQRRYRAARVGG